MTEQRTTRGIALQLPSKLFRTLKVPHRRCDGQWGSAVDDARVACSVLDFVGRGEPCGKAGPGLVCEKLPCRQRARCGIFAEFIVEKGVIEAGARCVCGRGAVVDGVETRPVRGGETHGTRLAACVEFAAGESEGVERLAGSANRVDFAVRCGIVGRRNGVSAFADDLAAFDDDGSEGASFTGDDVLSGQCDGAPEELRIW